jgi:hypothetical protein
MTPVTTQAQEARDPHGHAETGTNPAKSYKSCQKFLLGTCGNAMRPRTGAGGGAVGKTCFFQRKNHAFWRGFLGTDW